FTQPAIEEIRSKVTRGKVAASSKTIDEAPTAETDNQPGVSKPKDVKKETTSRKRSSDTAGEPSSKRTKSIHSLSDDAPEVGTGVP
ncbi:hypothetical protein A2U01_0051894, partial [Trifolium medium]|nr:hypothetical protein [Trifolium medium]